jgi:hemolysin III
MEVDSIRPLFRGWLHAATFLPAVVGAAALVILASGDRTKQLSLLVYGIALASLFGVSALYHRISWSPAWRRRLQRADHANIFVMIAATYTPISVTVLSGSARIFVLVTIWLTAGLGAALVIAPLRMPRWVMVSLYIAVGWVALLVIPALVASLGAGGIAVLLTGGALYSLGAVAYAMRRPRLWPRVFGYHELFHLLVVAASAVFFLFMTLTVLPATRS